MASFSESIAALFIMIGFFTRPSALLLLFTMLVASLSNIITKGIDESELSLIYLFLTLIIFIKGSDRFSLDSILFSGKKYRF
jgi:putative oxidoreductase